MTGSKKALQTIEKMTKDTPPKTERKTFRQAIRDTLYQMAQNEEKMQEVKEKNPQLYDLTMKVAIEEERRRQNDNER